jgi:outer membrane immunogenic protein
MKKIAMMAAVAVTAMAAFMAAPASAQTVTNGNAYASVGYTHFSTDRGDLGGVTGRLGYRITPYVGAEAEYTTGVDHSHFGKLDNAWGVYGVGTVPVTQNFDLLGRVGYQQINISGRNGATDSDGRGLGYGAGVQWHATPGLGIRGEYTRLTDADADTWSVSGVMNF